jgi:hypothetical protein
VPPCPREEDGGAWRPLWWDPLAASTPDPSPPAWSPDGRWIAFSRVAHPCRHQAVGDPQLYLISSDGSSLRPLPALSRPLSQGDTAVVFWPAGWAPDSRSLVYEERYNWFNPDHGGCDQPSSDQILRINTDGSQRQQIVESRLIRVGPFLSRDGRYVAYDDADTMRILQLPGIGTPGYTHRRTVDPIPQVWLPHDELLGVGTKHLLATAPPTFRSRVFAQPFQLPQLAYPPPPRPSPRTTPARADTADQGLRIRRAQAHAGSIPAFGIARPRRNWAVSALGPGSLFGRSANGLQT